MAVSLAGYRAPRGSSRRWRVGPLLSQGSFPACVGGAICNLLNADPVRISPALTDRDVIDWWRDVRERDPIKSNDGDEEAGTIVQTAANLAARRRFVDRAVRMRTLADVFAWLDDHGPVIVGVDWMSGMDQPNKKGRIRVAGAWRGGHAGVLVFRRRGVVTFLNDWRGYGPWDEFGQQAEISFGDLKKLWRRGMEAFGVVAQ